jgi:hypothetical protein
VTLSLAALAWGFQYSHYGLFLVATLSGAAFWMIEGTMKRHQMRFYFRMREIEAIRYELCAGAEAQRGPSPRIDSSWSLAGPVYAGKRRSLDYQPRRVDGPRKSYQFAWFFPHVFLPHALSFVAGPVLLLLGADGCFGQMRW